MENRRNWKRIPVFFLTLLAVAEVLSLGGPAGAAQESPLEILAAAGQTGTAVRAAPEIRTGPEEESPAAAVPEPPDEPRTLETEGGQIFAESVREAPLEPEESTAAPPDMGPALDSASEPAAGPAPEAASAVAESGAVEDTYFEDVVFLGDSRTEGFYLYSGLKTGQYLYAVGATVESVFTKNAWDSAHGKIPLLDALSELDFGKVYLMLGINELGWSRVEDYHDQYAKLIDRVREDHPDAVVVLQSILPVSAKQDAKGSYVNNNKILVYNQVIAALAEEKGCAFLDSAQAVTGEDGCLPVEWTFDGVHLNPAGCKILLEYYRTHSVP